MFKVVKIRRLKKEIKANQEMLRHMIAYTDDIKDQTFRNILNIKSDIGLGWVQVLQDTSAQEELFQLLLHRQFIGWLAENVRQKTFALLKLQGLISSGFVVEKEKYGQLVEKAGAKLEMERLLTIFLEEMKPLLQAFEQNDI